MEIVCRIEKRIVMEFRRNKSNFIVSNRVSLNVKSLMMNRKNHKFEKIEAIGLMKKRRLILGKKNKKMERKRVVVWIIHSLARPLCFAYFPILIFLFVLFFKSNAISIVYYGIERHFYS